jgi:hypothetical protein
LYLHVYDEIASYVQTEKAKLKTEYGKLTTDANQQGEDAKVLHVSQSNFFPGKNQNFTNSLFEEIFIH